MAPINNEQGENGIGNVLTLGAATYAATWAMFSFIQKSGMSKIDVLLRAYLPGALLPVAALLVLIVLTTRKNGILEYYLSRPSRIVAALTAGVAITVVAIVCIAGSSGDLPGQAPNLPRALAFDDVRRSKGDKPAIVATIDIDQRLYPEGLPSQLVYVFTLRSQIADRWKIAQIQLLRELPSGKSVEFETFQRDETDDPTFAAAPFTRSLEKDSAYHVDVLLLPRDEIDEAGVAGDVAAIKRGEGIRALDRSGLRIKVNQ